MLVLRNLDSYQPNPARPLILGLGNFDGVHLGHQKLLSGVCETARQHKGMPAILTFQEHPQKILHPGSKPELLMSGDYKLFLLKEIGIELCFWLSFTEAFSKISAVEFVEDILVKKLQVKEVFLGYNAHFGHGRQGDAQLMRKLAAQFGFGFEEIEPVSVSGDFVSSTRIRKLVTEGHLDQASECLGHSFGFFGTVVKGSGRGEKLGYPTANLEVSSDVLPPYGVYPVKLRVLELEWAPPKGAPKQDFVVQDKGPWLTGIMNYGFRPTFEGGGGTSGKGIPEVFIFDLKEHLYGKTVEVLLHPRLRLEKKFESVEALKMQIAKDVEQAKLYFEGAPK